MGSFVMKKLIKLGIIAFIAVIGFSFVGCKEDAASENTVDSSLHGTWKGDDANGTLTINKDGFTGVPEGSKAAEVASQVLGMQLAVTGQEVLGNKASYTTNDGKIQWKMTVGGQDYTTLVYTYKIDGSTLTIYDGDDKSEAFKGTKQ
jgi:hypothetical protein